mgnify:FL=1
MKIAVFGKTGQVATELGRRGGDAVELIGRDRADFSNPDMVRAATRALDADAIINAVAYTAVDKAESEPALAMTVNATSVAALAEAAAEKGVPVVQISTDYVFPGTGDAPWKPDDPTGPLGVYGATKLAGERGLIATGGTHAVLRSSWVFSAHGGNFVKTILRLSKSLDTLRIVADQVGGPTPAADIADACLEIARQLVDGAPGGTYHFSGTDDVSWATFAEEIVRMANLGLPVTRISTAEFPTPAKRPMNSRLDCTSLETDFGVRRPEWREGLAKVLKELSV